MEKAVSVDVIQTREDLEQYALNAASIETLMIPSLHQLVQVAIHILHTDV